MIYLYVKQHSITGLKYFGYTECKDPIKYQGSGSYWIKHINKHGKQYIKTIEIWMFFNKETAKKFASNFSKNNNIVESTFWANQVEENLEKSPMKGMHHNNETKAKIGEASRKRITTDSARINMSIAQSGANNAMFGATRSNEWKHNHSINMTGSGNPFFGKKRPDHAEKLKLLYSNPDKRPITKGKYITPDGIYFGVHSHSELNDLKRWCISKIDIPISKNTYYRTKYLKSLGSLEEILGKTPRDLGFNFISIVR